MKKVFLSICAFVLAFTITGTAAEAKEWKPKKAIELIVPAGAGGGTDLSARTFAKYAQRIFKKPVIVVNVKGAGGYSGTRQVYDAKPNGQKVLFFHSNVVMNKLSGTADYSYDGFDVGPIVVEDGSMTLFSQKGSGIKTVQDLIKKAKANPGKIKAATEYGAFSYFMFLKMQKELDIKFNLVDVGGGASKIAAMLGGYVDLIPKLSVGTKAYIDSGDFNAVGCFQKARQLNAPHIPTFEEQGIPFYFPGYTFTLFFPKGTPQDIRDAYDDVAKAVTSDAGFQKDIKKLGLRPSYKSPKEAVKIFAEMQEEMLELAKDMILVGKKK